MGKLILIRHGQSEWNLQNRFTGWIDVSLSKQGLKEAKLAGKSLKLMKFDVAFTSTLVRAQETLFEVLNKNKYCSNYVRIHDENKSDKINWYNNFTSIEEDEQKLKIYVSARLNERYYGDLQGLNKSATAKKYGAEQVHKWRRSFDIAPPNGESLKDTYERTIPYFKDKIIPYLKKDKIVVISAHGNSLRAITKFIEKISDKNIPNVEIPTGVPIIYELNNRLKVISKR